MPAALPDASGVGRVALTVDALEPAVTFYRDVVGLSVLEESAAPSRAVLGVDGEGETPLLVLTADPDAPDRGRDEAGLFHVAFRVPDRAALADALVRIETAHHLGGASDHLVSEALYTRDPDGNGVEIYCDRPRADWPETAEGVGIETLPLDLEPLRDAGDAETAVPPGTDVGHVHLEVTDLVPAKAFYVDALGMNVRATYGDAAVFVAAGDYHHHVGLNTWNGRTRPADAGRGLDWFELTVPDADALAAAADRLEGATLPDGSTVEVVRHDDALSLRDPDGIDVRLVVEADDAAAGEA